VVIHARRRSRGLVGGLIRQAVPTRRDLEARAVHILSTPRWLVDCFAEGRKSWKMLPLGGCIALELGRQALDTDKASVAVFSGCR